MDDGLLSLKWNHHKSTFFEVLKHLREKSNYSDVTVAVENKFYPVHKLVLSTCSEYFCEVFEKTPCKSPVIVLKDVRSKDLEALLDYMYLGEVNVNQQDLGSLLKTAECLRIKGLAVPDEEVTKPTNSTTTLESTKHPSDDSVHSPPSKRKRNDSDATSSKCPSPGRASTPISFSAELPSETNKSHDLNMEPTPLVKVEMDDTDDNFMNDASFEDPSRKEEEVSITKSEVPSPSFGGSNFTAPQHMAELGWEEGEPSYHPDAFGGGDSQQHSDQGGLASLMYGPVDQLLEHTSSLEPTFDLAGSADLLGSVVGISECGKVVQGTAIRFSCRICRKGFRSKVDLERHVRTHTGEKPFRCQHCSHCSATKGNLKAHMRHIHNDLAFQEASMPRAPLLGLPSRTPLLDLASRTPLLDLASRTPLLDLASRTPLLDLAFADSGLD